MIPPGAEKIIELRRKGKKPADITIVSLVGPLKLNHHQVFPSPSDDYDWRWIKDLDICVFFDSKSNWQEVVFVIKLNQPMRLIMWDVDLCKGQEVFAEPVEQIDPDAGATHPEFDEEGNIYLSGWRWEIRFNDLIEGNEMEFLQ